MDDPLTTLKVRDLRKLASTYQVKGRSKTKTKADLVAFLREHLTVDQIEKGLGRKKPFRKSETELFDLPQELIWKTLYNLPPRDALHFCLTHRKAGEICQNNDFWFEKIQRDFGELFDTKTENILTENRIETYKTFWKEAQTKLLSCASEGHKTCVFALLQIGVNPNLQNIYGQTALMHAAKYGYIGIARLLMEHGANPELQNVNGITALMQASGLRRRRLARLFKSFK